MSKDYEGYRFRSSNHAREVYESSDDPNEVEAARQYLSRRDVVTQRYNIATLAQVRLGEYYTPLLAARDTEKIVEALEEMHFNYRVFTTRPKHIRLYLQSGWYLYRIRHAKGD